MSNIDYSKWKNIEVSDDEDDTHPNIDTPSLFRWRHRARLERMEEQKIKDQKLKAELKKFNEQMEDVKRKLNECSQTEEKEILRARMEQLTLDGKELDKKKDQHENEKKKIPLNVDTINKEKNSRTIFNKVEEYKPREMTDEEKSASLQKYREENMPLIKEFGFLRRSRDSMEFLKDHLDMVCDEVCNLLVLWCLDLAMEEKFDLLDHVSHQVIVLQFILQLGVYLKRDPRSCVVPFFQKYNNITRDSNLEVYKQSFDDELQAFKGRIRKRALERAAEAEEEVEEEFEEHILEQGEVLGPGGLDPAEVFPTLPLDLQKCFESRDIEMLKRVISSMDPDDAEYHMKRCVDSGLWNTDAN